MQRRAPPIPRSASSFKTCTLSLDAPLPTSRDADLARARPALKRRNSNLEQVEVDVAHTHTNASREPSPKRSRVSPYLKSPGQDTSSLLQSPPAPSSLATAAVLAADDGDAEPFAEDMLQASPAVISELGSPCWAPALPCHAAEVGSVAATQRAVPCGVYAAYWAAVHATELLLLAADGGFELSNPPIFLRGDCHDEPLDVFC